MTFIAAAQPNSGPEPMDEESVVEIVKKVGSAAQQKPTPRADCSQQSRSDFEAW